MVNLKIEETYPKFKAALTAKDCKVISEEAPNQTCFKQGSLWGISPKTAKKIIIINLILFLYVNKIFKFNKFRFYT